MNFLINIMLGVVLLFVTYRFKNKLLNYSKLKEMLNCIKLSKNKEEKIYEICGMIVWIMNRSCIVLIILVFELQFLIKAISVDSNQAIRKNMWQIIFFAIMINTLVSVLANNIKIENCKFASLNIDEELKTKIENSVKKALLSANLINPIIFINISIFAIIGYSDVLGYKSRLMMIIISLVILTSILTQILRRGKKNFIVSIFILLFVYMFLLSYASVVCGSYYYAPGKSIDIITDIKIKEYLKNSFKLGMISFFNYSDGKNQAEYILKLAQFIIGKMIEWTYLGCFSALFIARMTSTENK